MKGREPTNRTVRVESCLFSVGAPCNMKRLSGSMLALLLAAVPIIASTADQKTLQNLKGSVTYGQTATPTNVLALHGQAALSDADFAVTGANSQATITLPDS